MTEPPLCPKCHKPQPNAWCWAGDFYCPLGYPPRYLDDHYLWREVCKLAERVAELEQAAWPVPAGRPVQLPAHWPMQGIPGQTAVLCSCGWFSVDYAQHLNEVTP